MTFAYGDNQDTVINLNHVDSFRKDFGDGYGIVFERALFNGNNAALVSIGRWRYSIEKDRDKAFKSIVNNHGLKHG
jgi:hypothetical protein